MRVTISAIAVVLCTTGPALAQDWDLFTSKEDGFKVDFPGQPRMTATTFKSEYGADLPAHVWDASRGQERYSVIVVDYSVAAALLDEKAKLTCRPGDERSCGLTQAGRGYWKEDMAGAILWATYGFIQRPGKMTHLAFAWQDLVWGHEIQMDNPNGSKTFAFISMHKNKLYIFEGTTPKGLPPPLLFQQSVGYVDKDGNGMRYIGIYSNMYAEFPEFFPGQPRLTGQGGGAGRGAGAAPAAGTPAP